MKILVAGGTYINVSGQSEALTLRMIGGSFISTLIADHSHHDVYLYTNFSSEEPKITKGFQKTLRARGVNPDHAGKVSSGYGRVHDDAVDVGTNIFETADLTYNEAEMFSAFDAFVLTTDMNERDFRFFKTFAHNHGIPVHVFTLGEYPVTRLNSYDTLVDLREEEDDGETVLPLYHMHKSAIREKLFGFKLIEHRPVVRDESELPASPIHKVWKPLLQLVGAALAITVVILLVLNIFTWLSPEDDEYATDVDDGQAVDMAACDTVGECRELGDNYLEELEEYIDILDEPHVFFENRTRMTYIDYAIDEDLNIAGSEYINDLPVGSEEEFMEIWERFTAIFPEDELTDVNTFRLFSDGEGNTLAYVDIREEGTTFAMDIRDNQSLAAQYRTLIHEFGHIYSLPVEDFDQNCGIGTELECLNDGTIMQDFIDRFWSQYGEDWLENADKSSFEREAFYNNNVTDFYVPYQATNAKEDYAITFLRFITEEMPSEDSEQLADIKVRSFYEDPELVGLRVYILDQLLELEEERAGL